MRRSLHAIAAVGLVVSCGGDDGGSNAIVAPVTDDAATDGEQRFPDVIGVEATSDGETWTFSVTISSPYDTPERYADAWRILGPDGAVLGERPLAHDHQYEQPFTRSLRGVSIPVGVDTVVVEGRDQQFGWGGSTIEYELPRVP